jgi:hypothetical protein
MAYVRKKDSGGQPYYQLVESRRVDGQPRQKVLIHLGSYPTVEDALKGWPKEAKRLRRDADKERGRVPAGWESKPLYRDILKRADALEKQADALEEKLDRLRQMCA